MREQILNEIRKFASANDGRAPGVRTFERETGIHEGAWRGVFWARWSDAVREAGLEPNVKQGKIEEEFFLTKIAAACRHFGKFPTAMELRMFQKQDDSFPNVKSITRHFGSLTSVPDRLAKWAKDRGDDPQLVALLGDTSSAPEKISTPSSSTKEGSVYLIRSGAHYKIGRSDELERRVKEIRTALPETARSEQMTRLELRRIGTAGLMIDGRMASGSSSLQPMLQPSNDGNTSSPANMNATAVSRHTSRDVDKVGAWAGRRAIRHEQASVAPDERSDIRVNVSLRSPLLAERLS